MKKHHLMIAPAIALVATFSAPAATLMFDTFNDGDPTTNTGAGGIGSGMNPTPGNDTARLRESSGSIRLRKGSGTISRFSGKDQIDMTTTTTSVVWDVLSYTLPGSAARRMNFAIQGLTGNPLTATNQRSVTLEIDVANDTYAVFLRNGLGNGQNMTGDIAFTSNLTGSDTDGFTLTSIFSATGYSFVSDSLTGGGINISGNWDTTGNFTYGQLFSGDFRVGSMLHVGSGAQAANEYKVASVLVSSIPEPSSTLSLVLGGFLLLRRRRP